ncbi:PTS fructose transporter subunit IIB [Halegenticoccus tardaugens]|uniref:PTS fructose transporter subunit IIB n=1 Tax=Halegenticoccus tardaugens TaxID=2071624 RepID=UPI00100AC370|nr:PTS fructose transporter subunit IIB [Halegenticoccus tardaugens]
MKFVAVTSCPTGIAHSQMGAENLRTTAEELGHEISVEVQGAMGAQDELTADEIAEADAVVIAADTAISRDRFEGKPVVKSTIKEAVNDAEGLLERAEELAREGDTGAASTTDAGESGDSGASDPSQNEEPQRVGGDPSKGLFARLKRLLS